MLNVSPFSTQTLRQLDATDMRGRLGAIRLLDGLLSDATSSLALPYATSKVTNAWQRCLKSAHLPMSLLLCSETLTLTKELFAPQGFSIRETVCKELDAVDIQHQVSC